MIFRSIFGLLLLLMIVGGIAAAMVFVYIKATKQPSRRHQPQQSAQPSTRQYPPPSGQPQPIPQTQPLPQLDMIFMSGSAAIAIICGLWILIQGPGIANLVVLFAALAFGAYELFTVLMSAKRQ
jgi:hypothetical protein